MKTISHPQKTELKQRPITKSACALVSVLLVSILSQPALAWHTITVKYEQGCVCEAIQGNPNNGYNLLAQTLNAGGQLVKENLLGKYYIYVDSYADQQLRYATNCNNAMAAFPQCR